FSANLGGLSGADAICQTTAESGAAPAGIYKAWLSDDKGSPSSRFTQSAAPYRLVNGTVVANDWADLTSGGLRNAIDADEVGVPLSDHRLVWSNTLPNGEPIDFNGDCADWAAEFAELNGNSGAYDAIDRGWTDFSRSVACDEGPHHLYCFQQGAAG
ncbi:MAG TPA: hypothetical protein VFI22_10655, partial [Thermomicrobiales bacterium]|nr:hypothetical protein [Thermomicrobiales bacterium]